MNDIIYRKITENELSRVAEINRQEEIRVGYEFRGGELVSANVHWDVPSFEVSGSGDHSVAWQIAFCRQHLEAGAQAIGAFIGETLSGIILITPEVRPGVAQIAYLLVGHGYRRMGIATNLVNLAEEYARSTRSQQLYVSATPSESAIGFYKKMGFKPVVEPLPELLELEPEDIHLAKAL